MRKWHRWLVVFSAIFMLWIGTTGFVGQVVSVAQHGFGEDHDDAPLGIGQGGASAKPNLHGATVPSAQGREGGPSAGAHDGGPPHDLYHFIIDLHSGNEFGAVGKIISILSGAALIFFSGSGMWMYYEMFRRRRKAGKKGLFWG